MRSVESVARAGHVADHELERDAREDLEGRDGVPERLPQPAQQREGRGGRIEGDEGGRDGGGARKETERCRGHDAERALGADEELLQVVAGVVLAQRRQPVEHAPVRQHDLQAEHERAHHAVAQHRRAPGVCRHDAAERRAAL